MDTQRIPLRKLERKPNNDDILHFFYVKKCGSASYTLCPYYPEIGQAHINLTKKSVKQPRRLPPLFNWTGMGKNTFHNHIVGFLPIGPWVQKTAS